MGVSGIIILLYVQSSIVLSTKSFGVPFCVPFSPQISDHPFIDAILKSHSIVETASYLKPERKVNSSEDR